MNKRLPLFIASGLLLLPLCACVGARPKGGSYGGESLSQQVARHDQQIQTLLSQVGQVEQVLPGQAEVWSQVQTMRQDLNSSMGKLEELQNQVSSSGTGEMAQLNQRITNLENLVRKIASQLAISTESIDTPTPMPSSPMGGVTLPEGGYHQPPVTNNGDRGVVLPIDRPSPHDEQNTPGGGVGTAPVDTAQALYDAGLKAFDSRNYKEAVVNFKDFSQSFPKHKLVSNAFFWEGECYYQLKDYARAALAYQEVIGNHPRSTKMQSAMLKQGIALYHAGKKPAAKERLQELVSRYPKSPEATSAKKFLSSNKF